MDVSAIVSNEDLQRGWAEVEVTLTNGKRETLRVFLPDDPQQFAQDCIDDPEKVKREWYPKILRSEPAFVESIPELFLCQIVNKASALVIGTHQGGVQESPTHG